MLRETEDISSFFVIFVKTFIWGIIS